MGAALMSELDFEVADWLGAVVDDPLERSTFASFRITAGPGHVPVTEVEDTIARTVRSHIYVPAYSVARWLMVNWWRLRWEPRPNTPSRDWIRAHSMAAIGGDYAWPAVHFSSDGEFVQIRLHPETAPDVCAIRYLRDVTLDIPVAHFEMAVERFLDLVAARLTACVPGERELSELREELRDERGNLALARSCKQQALAGIDPGAASVEWLAAVEKLVAAAGPGASEEILATLPDLRGGLTAAENAITAMRNSPTTVKLDWATMPQSAVSQNELPWERGARLAGELRARLGIPSGPVQRDLLEQMLDARLPLSPSAWTGERALRGGFRNGVASGRTALLVTSRREDSQRFYLARVIGAALLSSPEQHVLPVSNVGTALQKLERSFAQELLCPWPDLDAFTDQHGTDDDGITEAAEHFVVSEQVVRSALVNKKKLPRTRTVPESP